MQMVSAKEMRPCSFNRNSTCLVAGQIVRPLAWKTFQETADAVLWHREPSESLLWPFKHRLDNVFVPQEAFRVFKKRESCGLGGPPVALLTWMALISVI
jgi:hypothetical protein